MYIIDRIIDAHMHFSAKGIFDKTANNIGLDCTLNVLEQEFRKNNVVLGIGMGVDPSAPSPNTNPQIIAHGEEKFPRFMAQCLGVNPMDVLRKEQTEIKEVFRQHLQDDHAVGIKIYTGYRPYYATDAVYKPIYEIARACSVPVVFHMGDTANSMGRLKYSHPLIIDELAVDYPDITFVIAHCGTPWIVDAVEVAAKNKNVYIDLSGLMEGRFKAYDQIAKFELYLQQFRIWFNYLNNYKKLLYGSDWPLVDMAAYIEVIKSIIPEEAATDVFYNNALRVFPKLNKLIID